MKYNTLTIEEHTIIPNFLNSKSWILDLGCLNFKFSNELKKFTNNIICVDANPRISSENGIIPGFPIPEDIIFINKAIVNESEKQHIDYYEYHDINGNSIHKNENDYARIMFKTEVPTITIKQIMKDYNINQFDLIKFDIEGSEYNILENIDFTISKQFSIEFHDFRGFDIDINKFYEQFNSKIGNFCEVIQHERTHHPGWAHGTGYNYWDSLFLLKKNYWL
jgi:FkbM family methyltransferase